MQIFTIYKFMIIFEGLMLFAPMLIPNTEKYL